MILLYFYFVAFTDRVDKLSKRLLLSGKQLNGVIIKSQIIVEIHRILSNNKEFTNAVALENLQ